MQNYFHPTPLTWERGDCKAGGVRPKKSKVKKASACTPRSSAPTAEYNKSRTESNFGTRTRTTTRNATTLAWGVSDETQPTDRLVFTFDGGV